MKIHYPHPPCHRSRSRGVLLLTLASACLTSLTQAAVNLQSWTSTPWSATSGITAFSASVTDPSYNGGTSASFSFSAPKTGVDVTVPASPNFAPAAASTFGFESSGFGVGDPTTGRFTRGESFVLQGGHAFELRQVNWSEFNGDEILHISWTNGGGAYQIVYNVTANPSVFAPGTIVADAGTPITITNVSATAAYLSGRLRFSVINVALTDDPAVADPTPGSTLILNNWQTVPWNATNGVTSFVGAFQAPENGGTAVTFTFANAKTGVNVTAPSAPNFSGAAASFFGFEATGLGVGNSGTGRFERGESFTLQTTHDVQIDEITWFEFNGDEVLHVQWIDDGVVRQQVINVTSSRLVFTNLRADANTPIVITNVSPSTANSAGRLRLNYIASALVFATDPTYDPSGTDGYQQMFGVNLSGGEFGTTPGTYGTNYIYPGSADFEYFNNKGQKLIRLPFKWERVQRTLNGSLDASEMARLDTAISYAAARGMKVLLDMHNYARYNGQLIGTAAVPNAAFKDVWKKLADRYKTSTAIYGYGIMNEPNGTGGLWPAAAQAAADGILEIDTHTWIVVCGDGWADAQYWANNNPNLDVQDPQGKVIYEAHCYFAKANNDQYLGYDAEGAHPNTGVIKVSPFVNWLKARNARGLLGEYGVPKNDARWNVVLDRFMSYLYANGLSGTYWSAGPWWGSYPLSVEPTSNFTVDAPQMSILQNYQ